MSAKRVDSGMVIAGLRVLSVDVSQDAETVYSITPVADKTWTFIDSNGHGHYWDDGYPTLEWTVTSSYWCSDCHDEHEEGEYRCRICGVPVSPGTASPRPVVVKGARHLDLVLAGEGPEEMVEEVRGVRHRLERVAFDGESSTYVSTGVVSLRT